MISEDFDYFFYFFSGLTVQEFMVDICILIGIANGRFEHALLCLNVSWASLETRTLV